jgi:hypothetical protein
VSEEIDPFILYHLQGSQLECALWQIAGTEPPAGERALALFLSAESAAAYREAAGLAGWQVLRPARLALLDVLRACRQAGVRYAVLDPDLCQAKRFFDLDAILSAADEAGLSGNEAPGTSSPE